MITNLSFGYASVILFVATSQASAHKMLVNAKVDGDRIRVEAFYDNNKPAPSAHIAIENEATKEVVAEGDADERGAWSCPPRCPETMSSAAPQKTPTPRIASSLKRHS